MKEIPLTYPFNPRKQVIYFLFSAVEPHLKVGIAKDPHARAKALGEPIDFTRSHYVTCEKDSPRNMERILHSWVKEHQVKKSVPDGHTEWFSSDCWPELQSFINEHKNRFGLSELKLIPPPPEPKYETKIPEKEKRLTSEEIEEFERPRLQRALEDAFALGNFIQSSLDSRICLGQIQLTTKDLSSNRFLPKNYLVFILTPEFEEWVDNFKGIDFQGVRRWRIFYGCRHYMWNKKLALGLVSMSSSYDKEDEQDATFSFIKNVEEIISNMPIIEDPNLIQILKTFES